jgi:hypothetical protein
MCVVGAGRRARRGETAKQILAQYYPGLVVTSLDELPPRFKVDTRSTANAPAGPAAVPQPRPSITASSANATVATPSVVVRGGTTADLQQLAARAQDAMARALGVTAMPIAIDAHDTVEGFRQATGKPWWVSASVSGSTVDLAPLPLLAQRDGIEMTVRNAIAQAIVASEFEGRPAWVRVGAGRYFARPTPLPPPDPKARLRCPADAELTLAISAAAQREAESRAEACFARAYAASGDWRSVR